MNETLDIRNRVDEIIDSWRSGSDPNARAAFQAHPEIAVERALAIDLAYEEYCLRQEAGEKLDTVGYCQQFPTLGRSLARMLDVHRFLKSESLGVQVAAPEAWPKPGERWLDWKLVSLLGRGSFSRVFLAEEPALGNRQVVVKCSQSGPREAFILGRLAHPNIVPVHSIRTDHLTGLTAICMPYLGKTTMADMLDAMPPDCSGKPSTAATIDSYTDREDAHEARCSQLSLPERAAAATGLVELVARGLAAAHEAGVVHGDIKPSNILMAFDGTPMLVDFNLSLESLDQGARIGGTPPYMAPECLARLVDLNPHSEHDDRPDFRSDVFSLGAVLFELLWRRPPFEVSFEKSIPCYSDVRGKVMGPSAIRELADPHLFRILNRCLATDPADRFASAAELAASLAARSEHLKLRSTRRRFLRMGAAATLGLASIVAICAAGSRIFAVGPDERLLRNAIAAIEEGAFATAAPQLEQLQQGHSSQVLVRWIAYCHAKTGRFDVARGWHEIALRSDDRSGELWNNKAFCSAQLGMEEAEAEFTQALARSPELQSAFHGRGRVGLQRAMRNSVAPGPEVLRDFDSAIAVGPESAELHFDAAMAAAYAIDRGEGNRAVAEHHIIRALALGQPLESFQRSRSLFSGFELKLLAAAATTMEADPNRYAVLLQVPPIPLEAELPQIRQFESAKAD